MADTSNLSTFLENVADAIRTKKGTSDKISASNFDTEIKGIDTLKGQEVTIIPATSEQIVTPDASHNAITKATVSAVDNTIDSNIVAGNIKKDVEILGVTGTLEEKEDLTTELDDQDIAVEALNTAIQNKVLTTYNFKPEFVSFQDYNGTSLNLIGLDTSNVTSMMNIFSGCSALASITFGENWVSYGTQTYTDQTTGIWTNEDGTVSYTGLQALLEAGRTKGVIAGTWTKTA